MKQINHIIHKQDLINRIYYNNNTYDNNHWCKYNKKTLCKSIVLSGIAIPVIVPLPLCIIVSLLIMFIFKSDIIRFINVLTQVKKLYNLIKLSRARS